MVEEILTEPEAYRLFQKYGIPVADFEFIKAQEVCPEVVVGIEPPCYMKALVEGVAHKTEHGLVEEVLDDSIHQTLRSLQKKAEELDGEFLGVLIQKAIYGLPLMVGAKRDDVFGDVMLVGEGGTDTELRESVLTVLPAGRKEMEQMIDSHPYLGRKLNGYRGQQLDREGVIRTLERVACMLESEALENRPIAELDMNPFMVTEDACWACDGLIKYGEGRVDDYRAKLVKKNLDGLLKPNSVVLIGASTKSRSLAHHIADNLRGFKGTHYFVNIKGGNLFGESLYTSVSEVPNADLAVVAVSADRVPNLLEECEDAGIKNIAVIASGFSEIGEEKLKEEILGLAKRHELNILGPNGMGIYAPFLGLNTWFVPEYRKVEGKSYRAMLELPEEGNITIISQSGAVAIDTINRLSEIGGGIRYAISCGNSDDIDMIDLLAWLGSDDGTETIGLYIEGFRKDRGRAFIEVMGEVSKKKPIIGVKAGASKAGARGAWSHTASMTGDTKVYSAAFRKAGVIEARGLEEIAYMTLGLSMQPPAKSRKIAIVSNAGGLGVIFSDIGERDLEIYEFSSQLTGRLENILPKIASPVNPVDVSTAASDHVMAEALEEILKEKPGALFFAAYHGGPDEDVPKPLPESRLTLKKYRELGIPVFVYEDLTTPFGREMARIYREDDIPVFPDLSGAIAATRASVQYGAFLRRHGRL